MEDSIKKSITEGEKDIVFSKAVRAGKRIYYLDVKKSRSGDMFIAITESKKIVKGEDDSQVSFEKHKIFLYKEDFKKFSHGLKQTIDFIEASQGAHDEGEVLHQPADQLTSPLPQDSASPLSAEEIKIDIDF